MEATAERAHPTVPPPGAHGDDARAVAAALGLDPRDLLDLATTLNPVAPDVAAIVGRHTAGIRWYPDPGPATAALADALGVPAEQVVLTNGGSEAIALVAAAFPVGFVDHPDFSLYERHLQGSGPDAPRWASNPNNPLGTLAPDTATAFVWDEAHYPLSTGRWTRGDPGSLVVGSLTKLFACPGLRLGYALAPDPATADVLRGTQPRWSVGSLACDVLPELLERADLVGWHRSVVGLRGELASLLRQHGFVPEAGDAPWVLVPGSPSLRDDLAAHGVLVRNCASFGLPDVTRIAVPDAGGLARLAAALDRMGPRTP